MTQSPRGWDTPNRGLARKVTLTISITMAVIMGVYALVTTILEGRRFDEAVERDLLLLDTVVSASRARLSDAYQLRDTGYLREQLRSLGDEIPGLVLARAYDARGRLLATINPIPEGDPIRVLPGTNPARGLSNVGGDEVAWNARPIKLRAAMGTSEGPLLGYLVLGISQRDNTRARWTATALAILVGALTLGAMVVVAQIVVARALLRPIRAFSNRSRLVARGDLTQRFSTREQNEIGALGEALNGMITDLAAMIRRVREESAQVDRTASQIVGSASVVLADSRAQRDFLHSAEEAAQGLGRLLRDAVASIEALAGMSEDVLRSTSELQTAIRDIARAADNLSDSVDDVTGVAEEQVDSIRQVSLAVGQLTAFVNETADLAEQMDETLRTVEATVRQSLDLSLSVTERARRGREAVERSKAGMDEIGEAFHVTREGIERLREHSVQVADIVQVIDGVTKQVNLLALNASIIAAQAGEQGKRFSVVAAEIRDLAERTSVSASKIAGLVERLETDIEFCVQSMASGGDAVENGRILAEEALAVLVGILASSQQSTSIVQSFTEATQRHLAKGRRIAELMTEVRERVVRINALTSEQAEESRRILDSARRMGLGTREVKRASGEQGKGSLLIAQTMEKAREIVTQAGAITSEQDRVMARLQEVMRAFLELTERNLLSAETMAKAIAGLKGSAGQLTTEVEKFTL